MSTLRTPNIPVYHPEAGLKVTEIFYSLQGEACEFGTPTVFIRLTGCPLRCDYCDTTYSFYGGQRVGLEDILQRVAQYQTRYICVTGGEPLAQPNCLVLLDMLCQQGYHVSLETSGALDIHHVHPAVSRVLDVKTPSSLEQHRNLISNYQHLTPHDQIKFVISHRADYEWAVNFLMQHPLLQRVKTIWFSPAFAVTGTVQLPPLAKNLAEWILQDHLPVRFQLQLHKLLWQDVQGH